MVIWSPRLKKDTDVIEKEQRWFTKRLRGLKDLFYAERLPVWIWNSGHHT